MRRNNLSSPTEDRKYVFNLFKLEKERSQTALVAGANSISFVNGAKIFINMFETNIQGRSNTKIFTKVFTDSGTAITVFY